MVTIFVIIMAMMLIGGRRHEGAPFALSLGRCDVLKAILPFLIIVHHCNLVWRLPKLLTVDFASMGSAAVCIFFFISGYGMESVRQHRGVTLASLPSRIWKILNPLIIPALVYALLIGGIYGYEELARRTYNNIVYGFGIIIPNSWFVVKLAILYAVFIISAAMCKTARGVAISVSVATIAVMLFSSIVAGKFFWMADFAFCLGVIYNQYESWIIERLRERNLRGILIFIGIASLALYSVPNPVVRDTIRMVWLLAVMGVFAYASVAPGKIITFFKSISYEVYLCHGILLNPVRDMLPDGTPFIAFLAIEVALTIPFAWVSHKATAALFARTPGRRFAISR